MDSKTNSPATSQQIQNLSPFCNCIPACAAFDLSAEAVERGAIFKLSKLEILHAPLRSALSYGNLDRTK